MDFYSTLNSLTSSFVYSESTTEPSSAQLVLDFPPTDDPVYILGRKYSSLHELDEIREDVRSRIWITYRRNFQPIGDSGMISDNGWGCMLRTGQMILAQAFYNLHLGRDWKWNYLNVSSLKKLKSDGNEEFEKYCKYRQILKMFSDSKMATYSIHQIALMGASEGKNVGEWFGPNTIAQVLKKLSCFDKANDIYIHVAMDNVIFIDDIKKFCKSRTPLHVNHHPSDNDTEMRHSDEEEEDCFWRPLVLFIPLRLGLTTINPIYYRALKSTFVFPQSLGILGGRPNHALYFIGFCGDDLIHLDPHITQPAVSVTEDISQLIDANGDSFDVSIEMDDISYHCERASRMSISQLDPSISLCFLCRSEADFDQWANMTLRKLIQDEEQPMFEIMKERPCSWPFSDNDDEEEDILPKANNNHVDYSHSIESEDDDYEIIE